MLKFRWTYLVLLGCIAAANSGCTLKDPVDHGDICPVFFQQDEDGIFYFPIMGDTLHCYKEHISCNNDSFTVKFRTHQNNSFRSYTELKNDKMPLYSEAELNQLFYNPNTTDPDFQKLVSKTQGDAFIEACNNVDVDAIELCLAYQNDFDDLMNNVLASENQRVYIEKVDKIHLKPSDYTSLRDSNGNLFKCPASFPRCLFTKDETDGRFFSCVQSCFSGQELCDGSCVDVSADNRHCGECYNACGENTKCINGVCEASCEGCIKCEEKTGNPLIWNEHCGAKGACNNPDISSDNYIGTACKEGETCDAGSCKLFSCDSTPETPHICHDQENKPICVNKLNDPDYCNCTKCILIDNSIDVKCQSGVCVQECDSNTVPLCNSQDKRMVLCASGQNPVKCANLMTDHDYCGVELKQCSSSQYCISGQCVERSEDISHCGETVCTEKQACYNGKCITLTCDAGMTACYRPDSQNTSCVNLDSDADNCGFCGFKCSDHKLARAESNECRDGKCIYHCTSSSHINVGDKYADTIHCVNPLSDNEFCGKIDSDKKIACQDPQICVSGTCTDNGCEIGQILCSLNNKSPKQCVDITQMANCGECGNDCNKSSHENAIASSCSLDDANNYACKFSCNTEKNNNLVNIGPNQYAQINCVDSTSPAHCGAIDAQNPGVSCDELWACIDKQCKKTKEYCMKAENKCLDSSNYECIDGTLDTACGSTCIDCSENNKYCRSLDENYQCVECLENKHCNGNKCNAQGKCVQCLSSEDCGPDGICNSDGKCVGCTQNSDCKDKHATICNPQTQLCECDAGNSCSGDTPYCNADIPQCVQCTNNEHCEPNTTNKICNPATFTCVQCIDSCPNNQLCSNHICVECITDGNCKSQICDTTTHTCTGCTGDGACSAPTPVCDLSQHRCVTCTVNSHCNEQEICSSNKCEPVDCTDDMHCNTVPNNPYCNTETYECVECIKDEQCESGSCTDNSCVLDLE